MSDEWIVVPGWEKFQHYRDRNPAWIKLYTDLAHRDQWVRLSLSQRGLLVSLWVDYALAKGQLRVSDVPAAVRQKVLRRTLDSLVEAGFITLSASAPTRLDASSRASTDLEVEKEKDLPKKVSKNKPEEQHANVQPKDPAKAIEAMIRNGVITDPIDLEAELQGYRLNSVVADHLREMLL